MTKEQIDRWRTFLTRFYGDKAYTLPEAEIIEKANECLERGGAGKLIVTKQK